MAYNGTDWQNLPNTTTPINRNNLKKIEDELTVLDTAVSTNTENISNLNSSKVGIQEITGILNPNIWHQMVLPRSCLVYFHGTGDNFEHLAIYAYVGNNKYARKNEELINYELSNEGYSAKFYFIDGIEGDPNVYARLVNEGNTPFNGTIKIVQID